MLLCDAAQVADGKLYILGGGWSIAGPGPVTSAIAIKLEVPWDQTNKRHSWKLVLLDADGRPVLVAAAAGARPVEVAGEFEVGRPPQLMPGASLDFPLVVNLPLLPIPPGARYEWRLRVDGEENEDWALPFTVRPGSPGAATTGN